MNIIHDSLALPFYIKGKDVKKFEDIEEFHINEKFESIKSNKNNFWKTSSFNRALRLSKIYRQSFSMNLLDKYFTNDVYEQINSILQPSDFLLFENLSDFIDSALNNKIKLTWNRT